MRATSSAHCSSQLLGSQKHQRYQISPQRRPWFNAVISVSLSRAPSHPGIQAAERRAVEPPMMQALYETSIDILNSKVMTPVIGQFETDLLSQRKYPSSWPCAGVPLQWLTRCVAVTTGTDGLRRVLRKANSNYPVKEEETSRLAPSWRWEICKDFTGLWFQLIASNRQIGSLIRLLNTLAEHNTGDSTDSPPFRQGHSTLTTFIL